MMSLNRRSAIGRFASICAIGLLALAGLAQAATITVTDISPNSGALAGGQTVTITGVGFASGDTVYFAQTAATNVVVNSDTQIVCTTPSHKAGKVAIRVRDSHEISRGKVEFTYTKNLGILPGGVIGTTGFSGIVPLHPPCLPGITGITGITCPSHVQGGETGCTGLTVSWPSIPGWPGITGLTLPGHGQGGGSGYTGATGPCIPGWPGITGLTLPSHGQGGYTGCTGVTGFSGELPPINPFAPIETPTLEFVSPLVARPNPAFVGLPVAFSALIGAPQGDKLTYSWDFGNGTTGSGMDLALATYTAAGTYSVTLTVSDSQNSISQTISVVVEKAPKISPLLPLLPLPKPGL